MIGQALNNKTNQRVALIANNWINLYSGGRIHAMWLAYALAVNGYQVDYYTNCIPVFYTDLPDDDSRKRIVFRVNKWNLWKAKQNMYVFIVIVPHLARRIGLFDRYLFYPFASRLKERNNCKLIYVDFESPNWIQDVDPELRPITLYKYSNRILPKCDAILSTTKIGSSYAKKYYSIFNPNLEYYQLYLCINAFAAKGISIEDKKNEAMYIARFGQKHKGNEALLVIVEALPEGYTLNIMGKKEKAGQRFLDELELKAKRKNIRLVFYSGLTDHQKFLLMARSKFFFFSSKFEGYGIPPQESQYMGCKLICSDLPVLREVNPQAKFVDFNNLADMKEAVNQLSDNFINPAAIRKYAEVISSPDIFIKHLGEIAQLIIQ